MMKVLVAEDEVKVANFIIKGLIQNQIVCDHAADGKAALQYCRLTEYDAIILDIMMPKITGWEVISEIRQSDKTTPILILSACDKVEDRVKGLEAGADDYLVKPFSFSELLARLHSVTRRRSVSQSPLLKLKELQIDTNMRTVSINQKTLTLTDKEYKLLVTLASKPGKVFSRMVLAERVWGFNYDHDSNVVDVTLYRLRQKLEENNQKKLIQTVRGTGYVFVVD